jgi:putative oxidoreductase
MPIEPKTGPIAATLLRVTLGLMFLAHSLLLKLVILTLPGTVEIFTVMGLPGWLAYVVFAAEVVGGVMLVLGVQARWVALALTPILIGATWAHSGNGWVFLYPNGGWEYPIAAISPRLGTGARA